MTLHEMVERGDVVALKEAVTSGADVNQSFPDSDECLLSTAASNGNFRVVKLLLELGADPNHRESVTPPLIAAVQGDSLESVQRLIQAGAELDVRGEDGSTPLIDAAALGDLAIVKQLLEYGANPKLKDSSGNSALFHAADNSHPKIVELLSPLSTPKERAKASIFTQFADQGYEETQVDELVMAATRGEFDKLVSFVEAGIAADAITPDGDTALMSAANKNHLEVVRWLLDRGAKVNRKDIFGEYPLSYAAMGCHPEMYDFLYDLTDKKLRKRAERIKQEQIDIGNWPKGEE